MKPEDYRANVAESLQKLRHFNINCARDEANAKFYQTWIDQFEANKITCERFRRWIDLQHNYWNEKDRAYGTFLKSLLEEKS